MPLLPDQLDDFVNLTIANYDRGEIVSIALDNQHYFFAERSGMDLGKTTEDGGSSLKWKVKHSNTLSFEDSEMFHVNNPRRANQTIEAEVKWAKQEVSYMYDVDEEAFQGDSMTKIVDYVKLLLVGMYEDFFVGMEERLWSSPTSSTQTPRRWAGIPFWLQQASATASTDFAFSGGNPSGFTSGAGGISSSTYAAWQNGTFVYALVSQTDFIEKVVEACDKTYFRAPKKFNEKGGGKPRWGFYTDYSIVQELRQVARAGNDRIGKDVTEYMDTVMIRGTEVEWVPEFARSGSLAYTTAEPFYGVDWNNLEIVFQKGKREQVLPVKQSPNQITGREGYMINWCNSKVPNRRRHFAAKRATT